MRMMRTIELSGVAEIGTGIDQGRRWYQLKNLPGTPYIGLTAREVEKLSLCRDLLAHFLPDGIEGVIKAGIEKVSTLMEQAANREEAVSSKATRVTWGRIDYTPFQGIVDTLLQAIPGHVVCEIEYRVPPDETISHDFVPVRLSAEDEALNIEGWKVNDKGAPEARLPKTLAVHRILSCTPTRRSLKDCPDLPGRGGAFGLPGRTGYPVRVLFDAYYSTFLRERIWSDNQEVIDLPDGTVELRFEAASDHKLVAWVLSFGGDAQLLEPAHLRKRIWDELEAAKELYEEEDEQD